MELLDFICKSHDVKDDQELFGLLKSYVEPLGFDSLIFCLMTDHASIGEPAKHGIITGYPEDWMKYYMANDYATVDPICKESMLAQRVFAWDKIDHIRPYNKKERLLMNEATDAGLNNGVAVSLQNMHNEIVAFGFASSRGGVELPPKTLSVLKLISVQFYDIYQMLKTTQLNKEKELTRVHLSEREKEVLKWTAAGKSTPDIATIMNITERTVNYFLSQCFAKLDANCKTLVVVKAIRLGLIKLDSDFNVINPHRKLISA